jgi:hypothetical protein
MHYALPHFYFHATTAYAILRHNGVESARRTLSAAFKQIPGG